MASVSVAAAHVFLTPANFMRLVDARVIVRSARAEYDIDVVREQYIRHLQAGAAGRLKSGPLDANQERARKDKEMADKTALQNGLMRREIVTRSFFHRFMTEAFSRCRAKMLAIPSKLAPVVIHLDSIPAAQAKLTDAVHEALAELAETAVEATSAGSALIIEGDAEVVDDAPRLEPERQGRARQPDVGGRV